MSTQYDNVLKLSAEVQELSKETRTHYLLEAVHPNENAHSRILKMILEYYNNGSYPFLESFSRFPK